MEIALKKSIILSFICFIISNSLWSWDGMPNGRRFSHVRQIYADPTIISEGQSYETIVNLVLHNKSQRKFVIKAVKGEALAFLQNEAKILRKAHKIPGIVRHYLSIIGAGRRYEVLEYCPGGDLQNLLLRDGPRTEEEARRIFTRIAQALKRLHDRRIAHLDIKPSNIFLMADKTAKLGDFGISEWLPLDKKPSGQRKGSPHTMPFEVHTSRSTGSYDPFMADVFSLGATMATTVLGSPIFEEPGDEFYEKCLRFGVKKIIIDGAKLKDLELTAEFIDLVGLMTNINPLDRPSINQVLAHPWFKKALE